MKILPILLLVLFLAGCATYKFQKGKPPYNTGYVVSRQDYTILEYTVGKDDSVTNDITLAKERFKRRKAAVEYYYKKMGNIANRFKETFWDTPVMFMNMTTGVFRLPFIAISDYRYEHNPSYRKKVEKLDQERNNLEKMRINALKKRLTAYIQNDLNIEQTEQNKTNLNELY